MKFLHLSDLHLGKRIGEISLIEDQKYILNQILNIADREKPDGILIAGDVYDKSVPSVEAITVLDDFLVDISNRNISVFVISGNHDSAERLSFGNRLMDMKGVYVSPTYKGDAKKITLTDEFGEVNVYMLPFIKPSAVRQLFPEKVISDYTDALDVAICNMNIDNKERNILITHQFVTGASRCESEEISVGGTDNVNGEIFKEFDYVALGHIHRAQCCGAENIRYSGTPLKYSFSEANDKKTVTVIELCEKGTLNINFELLVPLRDLKEIRGTYEEMAEKSFYEGTTYQNDFMHITLTDEEDVPEALGKLRSIYHNLIKLDYDNTRTRTNSEIIIDETGNKKTPVDIFAEFYEMQNGMQLSDTQMEFVRDLIENIKEDEV